MATAIHTQIAESVLAKVPAATRKNLSLNPRGSYTRIDNGEGKSVARVTPKLVEFLRGDPDKLGKTMPLVGKDTMHRLHHITAGEGGPEAAASEADGPVIGPAEVAKAVAVAVKAARKERAS